LCTTSVVTSVLCAGNAKRFFFNTSKCIGKCNLPSIRSKVERVSTECQ
jgi:hypothetical protein